MCHIIFTLRCKSIFKAYVFLHFDMLQYINLILILGMEDQHKVVCSFKVFRCFHKLNPKLVAHICIESVLCRLVLYTLSLPVLHIWKFEPFPKINNKIKQNLST